MDLFFLGPTTGQKAVYMGMLTIPGNSEEFWPTHFDFCGRPFPKACSGTHQCGSAGMPSLQ